MPPESAQSQALQILQSLQEDPTTYDSQINQLQTQRQSIVDQLLSQQAETPQQAVGRTLSALIGVGVASALSGGRFGAGAPAAGPAIAADEDRARAMRQDKQKRSALAYESLGNQLEPLLNKRAQAEKANRELTMKAAEPSLAAAKAEATFPYQAQLRQLGRPVTNVTVNPADAGPPLDKATFEAMTSAQPGLRFQGETIFKDSGKYPTMKQMELMVRTGKLPPDKAESIGTSTATLARIKGIKQIFDTVKDKPAFQREIAARLPEFTGIGNSEKLLNSQVSSLSLQMTVDTQGSRPTDTDREAIEKLFARAGTDKLLGDKKMDLLIKTYELQTRAKNAALGAAQPLTPEEISAYQIGVAQLLEGNDPIAQAMRIAGKTSNIPGSLEASISGVKSFTVSKTGKTYTKAQLEKAGYNEATLANAIRKGELNASEE